MNLYEELLAEHPQLYQAFVLLNLISLILFFFFLVVVIGAAYLHKKKSKALAVTIAIFIGPLVYIYVHKWRKAIGLFALCLLILPIFYLWPYSIFNILKEVKDYPRESL